MAPAASKVAAIRGAKGVAKDTTGKGWFVKLKLKMLKAPRGKTLAETNILFSAVEAVGSLLDMFEVDPQLAINLAASGKSESHNYQKDMADRKSWS